MNGWINEWLKSSQERFKIQESGTLMYSLARQVAWIFILRRGTVWEEQYSELKKPDSASWWSLVTWEDLRLRNPWCGQRANSDYPWIACEGTKIIGEVIMDRKEQKMPLSLRIPIISGEEQIPRQMGGICIHLRKWVVEADPRVKLKSPGTGAGGSFSDCWMTPLILSTYCGVLPRWA